ncbi:MAG: flagellar basal-body MS-ring/collar protein FliF [Acidobacteriota bacterium]
MNPDQLLTKAKGAFGGLSPTQLATLAGAFVVVVGLVIGAAYWINRPDYTLLFADMAPEAAAQVVERLEAENVPYQLDAGGRAIRVPATRVDALRLQFASTGLPSSGRIGFEIFDRTQFGQTEFLEQVNYRRALEGEIARTIATLQEVENARVHIALGKDSLFTERAEPAKASVILKLRSSRPLAVSTVAGISNLVAASVEGLRPEAVVIVDTFGRPLARPAEVSDEPLGGAQLERQQRLEKELAARVVALLEPVVGAEHVRVNVALTLRSDSEERTDELWDPASAVVRSRQVSADLGPGLATGGIAGSRGNLPAPAEQDPAQPGAAPVVPANAGATVSAAPGQASRNAETTNYEISRTTRHTVRPRGDIARMSVAVILDHEQVRESGENGSTTTTSRPREPAELQKIQSLVAAAVGLDTTRGDQLTVENISFTTPFQEELPDASLMDRYGPLVLQGARILGIVLLASFVIFGVVRPTLRRALGPPVAARAAEGLPTVTELPKTVEQLEGEIERQLLAEAGAGTPDSRRIPVLTKHIRGLTMKDPHSAAGLVRAWLAEDRQ